LKEGDVVKFGKVIFRIREIFIQNSPFYDKIKEKCEEFKRNSYYNGLITNNNVETCEKKDLKSMINNRGGMINCRFCLNDDFEPANPLINPCKCSGTMKYIHMDRLKQWIKTKIEFKQSVRLTIFKIKPIDCELCKFEIPGIKYLIKIHLKSTMKCSVYLIWKCLRILISSLLRISGKKGLIDDIFMSFQFMIKKVF
jgi:hypothetical protein